MNHDTNAKINELKERISQLKNEIWNLLDEFYYYTNIVYSQIMFEYDSLFGDLEEQILERDKLVKELEFKINALSSKNNHKNHNFTKPKSANNYEYITSKAISTNNQKYFVPNCKVNEQYEAQQLYRQIVKKLHPDVAGITPEFERFWNNIQDSYKNTDVQRLRIFYQTIVQDPTNKNIPDQSREIAALQMEIRDLEYNLQKLKTRLKNMLDQEPYIFRDKLKDKFWIAARKQKLMLKLFQIDNAILDRKRTLRNLAENNKVEKV